MSTTVARPVDEVFAAIADEHRVLEWSAWPAATGYSCGVHGDGTSVGSDIRFTDPGRGQVMGRQRLVDADPPRLVRYEMENRGPFGLTMRPVLVFRLTPLGEGTRVDLDFTNPLPAPLRVLARLSGFSGRIHALHVEDLRLLAAHVEREPA